MNRCFGMVLAITVCVGLWGRGAFAQGTAGQQAGVDTEDEPNAQLVKRYPFRGSTFSLVQSVSAVSLDRSADQTWNPAYSWLMRLAPRYYLTDKLSLRLKLDLAVEWTNADDTTYYQQSLWGDSWLDAVYANAYVDKLTKISLTPSLRLVLPTSKASQARSLYFGLAPAVAARRSFKLPRKMGLDLAYSFSYTKSFNHYTTLQYDAPTISCNAGGGGGTADCGQFLHSGSRNPSHTFTNILMADLEVTKKLRASLMVAFMNSLLYDVTTGEVAVAGGSSVQVGTDPAFDVNHRAAVWYLMEIGYDVLPALNVSVGASTYNPQLTEDSQYRAPFFNRYTEFSLSTTINLDQLVAAVHNRSTKSRALVSRAQ